MRRPVGAVAAATLSVGLLSGCSTVVSAVIPPSVPGIAVGQCTDLQLSTSETEVSAITTVDCALPHGWEAYAEHTFADGDFPGVAAIQSQTTEFCLGEFEAFIGVPYEESEYELQYLYPTELTWTHVNDRLLTCLVGSASGGVTGSLKGVAR